MQAGGWADPCFDIYVYGAEDGNFMLTIAGTGRNETKHISGRTLPGFAINQNYVIFSDVNIGDSNAVTISFDNVLDGLQLKKKKQPLAIIPAVYGVPQLIDGSVDVCAPAYDVAYETNRRSGEPRLYGPDIAESATGSGFDDVQYLDAGEYMKYDITVDDINKGFYDVTAWVDTANQDSGQDLALYIYVDDILWGGPYPNPGMTDQGKFVETSSLSGNLFAGNHTFEWLVGGIRGFNITRFTLYRRGDIFMNDCNDVYKYNFNSPGDLNHDCHVDFKDLKIITDGWLKCNDPCDPNCICGSGYCL